MGCASSQPGVVDAPAGLAPAPAPAPAVRRLSATSALIGVGGVGGGSGGGSRSVVGVGGVVGGGGSGAGGGAHAAAAARGSAAELHGDGRLASQRDSTRGGALASMRFGARAPAADPHKHERGGRPGAHLSLVELQGSHDVDVRALPELPPALFLAASPPAARASWLGGGCASALVLFALALTLARARARTLPRVPTLAPFARAGCLQRRRLFPRDPRRAALRAAGVREAPPGAPRAARKGGRGGGRGGAGGASRGHDSAGDASRGRRFASAGASAGSSSLGRGAAAAVGAARCAGRARRISCRRGADC